MFLRIVPMVLALGAAGAVAAPVATSSASASTTTERLVVRLKPGIVQAAAAGAADATSRLSASAGAPMRLQRTLSTGAQVWRLERPVPLSQARAMAWRLAQDPQVASAEPDVRVQVQAADDPRYPQQWPLHAAGADNPGGANVAAAWARSVGDGVTVAVIDTGILPSGELAGRVLGGHDLIGDDATSGDGTPGRDADATDPGDSCPVTNPDGTVVSRTPSTWHGLRVASLLAAAAGNGYGIAGAAPGVRVQPVRALGKCGGWMSDIADAVAWSAGLAVEGLPRNTAQPRVINLSLGGDGACTAFMQEAIDAANAKHIVVVAAAGNGGSNRLLSPANCSGVIVVGAHTRSGDLARYSNFGPTVTLTAPGGGACAAQGSTACRSDLAPAIGNTGSQGAALEDPAATFSGTSAAAPHVSATVAMILAAHPEFGVREVKSVLERSARKPPAGTWCAEKTGFCGAGQLDAGAAMALADSAVRTPYVDVDPVPAVLRRGALLPINAVAVGASDFVWTWRQLSGPPAALLASDGPEVQAQMPTDASGTVVFEAVATSAANPGQRATARVAVDVNEPPVIEGRTLTAAAGRAMALPLGATDPEGGTLELSYVGSAVPGLQIVDGELRWSEPAAGTYAFQVVAVDDEGGASGANFTLTVTAQQASPAPDATAAGGGGGGASGEGWLLSLLLAAGLLQRARRGMERSVHRGHRGHQGR